MKSLLSRSWYIFACITLLVSLAPSNTLTLAQEVGNNSELPAEPAQLEFYKQLGGANTAMETQNGYLYLGSGNSLLILSLANPANPTVAGQYTFDEPYPCPVNDLAVSGNYAYVACGDYNYIHTYQEAGGFRVVNISNPTAPVEVAQLIAAEVYDIAVNGSYAYVSPGVNCNPYRCLGLWIYDISDPANPQKLTELLVGDQRPLYVTGDRLYVGGCVFDISNPAAPIELGCPLSGFVGHGFQFIEDTQYISYNQWLIINDFSQPLTPTLIGYTYPISATGELDVQDGFAYISGGYELSIVDVSDLTHPFQVGFLQIMDNPSSSIPCSSIKVVAGYAYLISYYGNLMVIDVRNPEIPVLVGKLDTPPWMNSIASNGWNAIGISAFYEIINLKTIDLHSTIVPEVIDNYDASKGTSFGKLIVSQNYGFTTSFDNLNYSVDIFDLSNPANIIKTGSYPTGGFIQNIAVSNDYAYLVENDANNDPLNTSLRILDVSNPASPASVEFRSYPYLKDVAARGNNAYLTYSSQLTILDVTDPASPVERDSIDIYGDLALGPGDFLYTFNGNTLAVLDISNPDDILFVKNAFTSFVITDLVVEGSYAFGVGEYGAVVLDVTDPANPIQVAERRLDGCRPDSVAVAGSQVLVGSDRCGLIVLQWTPQEKTPVILVPGWGASWNGYCFYYKIGCTTEILWGWQLWDPNTQDSAKYYYDGLAARFSAAGYSTDNGYFKVHFYDWTNTLSWNADYLRQTIEQVKADTGASTVNLIGHSMGGLVARAYVQSSNYANDVAHLITLGSPHKGLAAAYGPWEGLSLAEVTPEAQSGMGLILNWLYPLPGMPPLLRFRSAFPGTQDLLPSQGYYDNANIDSGYLYDETNSDLLIPEADMHQRNLTLNTLNQNRSVLLTRTQMTTIAGSGVDTLARYYVAPPAWWEWPHWEDGKPNSNRRSSFYGSQGDNTVMVDSALLPDVSTSYTFPGIGHGSLPSDPNVINVIFDALGIPMPTTSLLKTNPMLNSSLPSQPPLVISLYGSADFTVTDALGRSVGPLGSEIAETKYISHPSSPYKLVLIPHPLEGQYQVQIEGAEQNDYRLGLMNTFNPASEDFANPALLWDASSSAIEPGATVNYVISYTLATTQTVDLIAATPVIEAPVWITATIVTGRFLPGQVVEIRDADTQAVLGSATSDAQGHFSIQLSAPLNFGQRLVAWSIGLLGVPVKVQTHQVFLPLTKKP